MTTTTKIFIILVCLFAFIFTPMAIQFAARTNDWQRLARDYQDQAETDAARARSLESLVASELASMAAQRRQYMDDLAQANRLRDQLNQQIADLTAQRDQLALDSKSLRGANELLSATMAVITGQYDLLTKSGRDLTRSELELKTRNAELTDTVKDLNAQLVVLRQELNRREQQLVSCREENETFRRNAGIGRPGEFPAVGPAPTARATTPPAGRRVEGRVKSVQGNLATLDVGANSGLSEGVKMVVLRGDEYICDLVITSEILPNQAVGEVVAGTEQSRRIRPGDTVLDEVTFLSRG